MVTLNFYLKNKHSEKPTPIFLMFSYNEIRFKFNIRETVLVKYWNFAKQECRVLNSIPTLVDLNKKLQRIKTDIESYIGKLDSEKTALAEITFRENIIKIINPNLILTKPKINENDALEFFVNFYEDCKSKISESTGKPLSSTTVGSYFTTLEVVREFKQYKYKSNDFLFSDINYNFYVDFKKFLINIKSYKTNTVGKHITILKVFLNEAHARGFIQDFNFKKFSVINEKTDSVYLDKQELDTLLHLDLESHLHFDKIRDLFLVGCYTGLRFSDFSTLQADNFKDGFIDIRQIKTGDRVVIPIHDNLSFIMQKYHGITSNSLPTTVSNKYMNDSIREICKIAGFDEEIDKTFTKGGKTETLKLKKHEMVTSHTARRSFASNQFLAGFPIYSIMKITGHRTETSFMKYLKITPMEHAIKLKELWDNQILIDKLKRQNDSEIKTEIFKVS